MNNKKTTCFKLWEMGLDCPICGATGGCKK